tara:strand:+ start:1586 stop:1951 length:366 start_codon:yes stop_codon:yes gene_type:complete
MFEQSLQYQIANKMKQVHDSLQNYPTKDVAFMLFKNLQVDKNKTTGFKLTKLGFQLLKKEYDTYRFPVAEGLHNKLLLKLHSHMKWPYALERKHLYLFSEEDAMWLKLVGDDVEKFANSLD